MKKALILGVLMITMPCALAYIQTEEQITAEFMRKSGWSSGTVDMVETTLRQTNSNFATQKVSALTPKNPEWKSASKWRKTKYYNNKN